MPVTISLLYREYERLLSRGELRLDDIGCSKRRVSRRGRADGADAPPGAARAGRSLRSRDGESDRNRGTCALPAVRDQAQGAALRRTAAQALRAGVDRAPGVGVLERRSEPAEHRLDPARRSDTGAHDVACVDGGTWRVRARPTCWRRRGSTNKPIRRRCRRSRAGSGGLDARGRGCRSAALPLRAATRSAGGDHPDPVRGEGRRRQAAPACTSRVPPSRTRVVAVVRVRVSHRHFVHVD